MGLDMYIYRKQYVSDNWDVKNKAFDEGKPEPKLERNIKETQMLYLRKANQIHEYFVSRFGGGEDNCKPISIELEDILELKKTCEKILKESKLIKGFLEDGYGYDSRIVGETVPLAKRDEKNLVFVECGSKPATELEKGDLIYQKDIYAERVESIELKDDRVSIHLTNIHVGEKIENSELARDLLPTQGGFFFGSTSYDEWYLEDLRSYVEQAEEIEREHKELVASGVKEYDIDYYYEASW